jgi:catechol 2,3-dioxygenase-like lactoylglutathione lyase family enzyme
MQFQSSELVVKISTSNVLRSVLFYTDVLGLELDDRYTLNVSGTFEDNSYVQLNYVEQDVTKYAIGLFKDISAPFDPMPENGTVPSFIVEDIEATLRAFQEAYVTIDTTDGQIIISNTSDKGYTDHFFFFRDPDNNSLVIRQNMKRDTLSTKKSD